MATTSNTPPPVLYLGTPAPLRASPPAEYKRRNLNMYPIVLGTVMFSITSAFEIGFGIWQSLFGFVYRAITSATETVFTGTFDVIRTATEGNYGIPTVPVGFHVGRGWARENPGSDQALMARFRQHLDFKGGKVFKIGEGGSEFVSIKADIAFCTSLPRAELNGPVPDNFINITQYRVLAIVNKCVDTFLKSQSILGRRDIIDAFNQPGEGAPDVNLGAGFIGVDNLEIPLAPTAGGVNELPQEEGIFFPYFSGMIMAHANKSYVPQIIARFFQHMLGSTADSIDATLELITDAFTSISSDKLLEVYAHIFFGIELARQGCVKMFVVRDPLYSGFFLYGKPMKVKVGIQTVISQPWAVLQEHLSVFIGRESTIRKIAALLSEIPFPDGSLHTVLPEMLSTDWSIAAELLKRRVFNVPQRSELQAALNHISEGRNFWTASFVEIQALLTYLGGSECDAYGMGMALDFTNCLGAAVFDRISLGFAAFGNNAPTWIVNDPKGLEFSLAAPENIAQTYAIDGSGSLKQLPVYTSSALAAANAYRHLVETKKMRFPVNQNKKPIKFVRAFTGEPGLGLFKQLASAVQKTSGVKTAVVREKRKLTEEQMSEREKLMKRLRELEGEEEMEL